MSSLETARVKIGIVGAGFGGYGLTPAFRHLDNCEVVAIAASNRTSSEAAAEKFGIRENCTWQEMVSAPDIDAVAIAVPPALQTEIATAAIKSGKAVFAEKPLAHNLEDAKRLATLATESGLANMVDFIFPELVTWRKARELINAGELGRIRHVFLDWRMESFDIRTGKLGWKTTQVDGGGVSSHFGAHALYYLEEMIGHLSDIAANTAIYPEAQGAGETLATISLRFRSGASGVLTLCSAALLGNHHCLEIYGEDGSMRLVNRSADPVLGFQLYFGRRDSDQMALIEEEVRTTAADSEDSRVSPVSEIAARFVDWIRSGKPARPDFQSGYRVQALLDAVYRSANRGDARIDVSPEAD